MSEPEYTPPDLTLLGEDHIRAYRETGGEVGHLWNGAPTLLLTARGRRTGEPRTVALIYGTDGDDHPEAAPPGAAVAQAARCEAARAGNTDHGGREQVSHPRTFLVVASMGGAPVHPQWYRNLVAEPRAEIQVRGDHLPVVARTAAPDEKPRLWDIVRAVWPNYDTYQARTDRDIPVVVLSPVTDG